MTKSPDRDPLSSNGEPTESIVTEDTTNWVLLQQAHYDRTSAGELATALAYTIADAKGVDPLDRDEMPPLYDYIDAQALEESFFGPSGADTPREEDGVVTFSYTGYKVAFSADGWIFVYEPR